jgi:hypothetical protein
MPLDNDRNRVLAALRDEPHGADSAALATKLGIAKDEVERHLLYCADYALVSWNRHVKGLAPALITTRGRDYLRRQSL